MRCKCYTQKDRRCKRLVKSGEYCFQHVNCSASKSPASKSPASKSPASKSIQRKRVNSGLQNEISAVQLFNAVARGNLNELDRLLKEGGDLEARDDRRGSLLHTAVRYGYMDIIDYLIAAGINVDTVDKYGGTPLRYALDKDNKKYFTIVKKLMEKGRADINIPDNKGRNGIYVVAEYFHNKNLLNYLLQKGADFRARTNEGKTPKEIAKEKGNTEFVKILQFWEDNHQDIKEPT